jgi:hypothetical protein
MKINNLQFNFAGSYPQRELKHDKNWIVVNLGTDPMNMGASWAHYHSDSNLVDYFALDCPSTKN